MRKIPMRIFFLLVLTFSISSVATAEGLEEVREEVQAPAILEPEEAPEEAAQSLETPRLPESFELKGSGETCGTEDVCQNPLPACEVAADCLAHCPAACDEPICVPLRLSVCISALPPAGNRVCQCYGSGS